MSNEYWSKGVVVYLSRSGGGCDAHLDPDEEREFDKNPGAWVARYFNCTSVEEYREWVDTDGQPYCAGMTAAGKPCANRVSRCQLDAPEWRALNRVAFCHCHQEQE